MFYPLAYTSEIKIHNEQYSFTTHPQLILPLIVNLDQNLPAQIPKGELIENITGQEMESSAVNESDYMLQKSANLPKYHTFSTLNEIVMDNSNDRQADRKSNLSLTMTV